LLWMVASSTGVVSAVTVWHYHLVTTSYSLLLLPMLMFSKTGTSLSHTFFSPLPPFF
jgi:hypothetical protein